MLPSKLLRLVTLYPGTLVGSHPKTHAPLWPAAQNCPLLSDPNAIRPGFCAAATTEIVPLPWSPPSLPPWRPQFDGQIVFDREGRQLSRGERAATAFAHFFIVIENINHCAHGLVATADEGVR